MVLSYKSQLQQHNDSINCDRLVQQNSCSLETTQGADRLTINCLEEHTQDFPSFCPTVSPLALENLNRYS